MLTEEGKLLSSVQGETVVDYDIDEYASKLEDVRATGRELRDTRTPWKNARAAAHQPLWCWFDFLTADLTTQDGDDSVPARQAAPLPRTPAA